MEIYPSQTVYYVITAKDPNGVLTVKDPQTVKFQPSSSSSSLSKDNKFELVLPSNMSVQKILRLKWTCQDKPMEDTVLGTGDASSGIYVTLGEPLGAMKDHLRLDVLQIAYELAKGLKTDTEVRDNLTSGVFNWLAGLGFSYYAGHTHLLGGGKFCFSKQMQRSFLNEKEGDCEDISALFHVFCCALGVESKLMQFIALLFNSFTTNKCIVPGIQEIEEYEENGVVKIRTIPIVPRTHKFQMHQVAESSIWIWDPTLKFTATPNFARGMLLPIYKWYLTLDINIVPKTPFSVQQVY